MKIKFKKFSPRALGLRRPKDLLVSRYQKVILGK